ncbi:MAG: methyltransferase [Actinomycetia bacterium]|nr:methyltransferase [Actinomycetes bacterium]
MEIPNPDSRASRADPGSYRDPGSRVFHLDGNVYRFIDERSLSNWERLTETKFFSEGVGSGQIVDTELVSGYALDQDDGWAAVLRHERIPVISYPYEWTFSMLREAAILQLDLLLAALAEGMILKDSTPFNVQWRGTAPVFIDIGSFEILEEGEVWVGYRQFLAQYLYPLMLTANVGVPFQPWLRGQPDGLTAQQMNSVMSRRDLMRKSGLLHVALLAKSERSQSGAGRDVRSEFKEAGFSKEMIVNNVKGLRKIVSNLSWEPGTTRWNEYATGCDHVGLQRDAKAVFVTETLSGSTQSTVWDLGANDGHFSRIAAETADQVLALDSDYAVLDDLFVSLQADGPQNILPLVQDLADPSPGIGWRGTERPPLAERSTPDVVLCLAVIHHLVIGRNIPLGAVIDWFGDLGADVILEWVAPDDPMVLGLTANRKSHEIHRDYTEDELRSYLSERFIIDREQELPGGTRRLFALKPRV